MIDLAAIHHRPNDNYAYPYHDDLLHIRIKTKKGNIESIHLIYGDQYEFNENGWITNKGAMHKTGTDSHFDYWLLAIKPITKRVRYGFILKNETEEKVYTEKGFFEYTPEDPGYYFCFPYLHTSEVFRTPEWVKSTVWYQIFPERFANGDAALNPPNTVPWNSELPTTSNFFGGDFQGVIDHLDYLINLGITGIYFTPIFKASSNHKYDTVDYYEIDPQFGDKKKFKELVSLCHQKGIRVMLDAVFNHSGYHFPPFQDVLDKGADSKYKDWFHISEFPLQGGNRPNYATFGFFETMPKFHTQHLEVKEYLLNVAKYWIQEFDIDGWRLDVANEINHSFWRDFRTAVKQMKPDIFILGEVWHDAIPWLRGDQFDSVMNYPFLTNVINFFAKGNISPKQFIENMTTVLHQYPITVNETIFNLVGSHDTPRILNECNNQIEKVKLIYTFLMTFIGTPCIYYGDELGLTGEMDPGCRKCMPWNNEEHNITLFSYIKKLIQLRKEEPLLANKGEFMFLTPNEDNPAIAFTKWDGHRRAVIILNPSDTNIKFPLPFVLKGKKIVEVLTNKEYAIEADNLYVTLHSFEASILLFDQT